MILDDINEEIKKAESILILTHENPDGDAVGTSLAVYLVLKQLGKNVELVMEEVPRTFDFLTGANEIKKEPSSEIYDLAIALDCADIKRLNVMTKYYENAKKTISIDHHGMNTMFADLNYVNPVSPACAQIILSIFEYFEIEITKEIGECLLTGIITDTGGFKYNNVTVETFEFAAELLKKGVNVSNVYERVMQIISKSRFELTRIATNRLELLENGKIAYTYVTLEDMNKVQCEPGDHEGIVEEGRRIEGVEVSVFLRESEKGYKVSMRSTKKVNVADIAMLFGGGGHERAAGCTMATDLNTAREKIITEIVRNLE